MRIALIGATGLVGARLARRLLDAEHEVHALQRRPSGAAHPRLHEHVARAGDWPRLARSLDVEAAISALGTTMRKAGSEVAFRLVDHDAVIAFAGAARAGGARRMIAVSSIGADPAADSFYLRLKGEVEQALAGLGFDRLDILRPGLLRGPRGGDRRLGERLGILLSPLVNPLLRGSLDRFAAIDADIVAAAAAALLVRNEPGIFVHRNRELRRLARGGHG